MDEQLDALEACVRRHGSADACALYFEALGMEEEKVYFHCDQVRARLLVAQHLDHPDYTGTVTSDFHCFTFVGC